MPSQQHAESWFTVSQDKPEIGDGLVVPSNSALPLFEYCSLRNALIHPPLLFQPPIQIFFLPISKPRQCFQHHELMASFLKHPSVQELARIMSKAYLVLKPKQMHTNVLIGTNVGRLSKGDNNTSDNLLPSKKWTNSILRLTTCRNKPGLSSAPNQETPEQDGAWAWGLNTAPHKMGNY